MSAIEELLTAHRRDAPGNSGEGLVERAAAELASLAAHSLEWQAERDLLRVQLAERDRREAELLQAWEAYKVKHSQAQWSGEPLMTALRIWAAKGGTP